MTTTLSKPAISATSVTIAIEALQAAFPLVPASTVGRAVNFLGLLSDGMVALRRNGKAVTPSRYADLVDAAVAKAFDMSRCRQ